jgi:hypothetical protein
LWVNCGVWNSAKGWPLLAAQTMSDSEAVACFFS